MSSHPKYPSGAATPFIDKHIGRADSRFAPSRWETALLCNAISHWLGASLESALHLFPMVQSIISHHWFAEQATSHNLNQGWHSLLTGYLKLPPPLKSMIGEGNRSHQSLLTHMNKMTDILQTIFSNAFTWKTSLVFWFKILKFVPNYVKKQSAKID